MSVVHHKFREVCEIKFAHILSLWDNLKIAAPPLPLLSQFCKKCANVPGNFAIYFSPIFSLTKALNSWCFDLSYSYPRQSKKIWTYTVYFIPDTHPQNCDSWDCESTLISKNFGTTFDNTLQFLKFVANRKKLLFPGIGCSTGFKNQILTILSGFKGWVFGSNSCILLQVQM